MKIVFIILLALVFYGYANQNGQPLTASKAVASKKQLPANTIESVNLLKMFAIEKGAEYNMYDWATGADVTSPIIWLDSGIVEKKESLAEDVQHPYQRRGEVYIFNQGKITHTKLEKKIVNGKWNIKLLGARGGYSIVEIDPDVVSSDEPKLLFNKKYVINQKHCNESAMEHTSMYLLQFGGKKPFWLKEIFSSGSAGGAYYYTIMYDKKPECNPISVYNPDEPVRL